MASEGFVFNFDGDGDAGGCMAEEPAEPAPEVLMQPVELHPFGGVAIGDLLQQNAACTKGCEFEEIMLDDETEQSHDADRRSLMHVLGARVANLQVDADPAAGADGAADGDEAAAVEEPAGEMRDIVPGQYLGGLKVWSCAVDLARAVYRAGSSPNVPSVVPSQGATPLLELLVAIKRALGVPNARILELGCGHGLPGLAALACGAQDVGFHDFNHEAIERCLLPNLCATFGDNLKTVAVSRRKHLVTFDRAAVCRAGSGAWASFAPGEPDRFSAEPILFDGILGADVTYDDEATAEFVMVLARVLKPGGAAFIGTKVYYFGTGGGLAALEREVRRYSVLGLELALNVPVHTEGDSMPRHIVMVTRRSE